MKWIQSVQSGNRKPIREEKGVCACAHVCVCVCPQYAINIGLTKGPLTNRKAAELRALFARSSHRLSHIPSAVVQTVDGQMCTVPLPGPRGVPGYEVGS